MSENQQGGGQPPRLCPFSLTSRVIKSSLSGGKDTLQALGTPCIGPGCVACVGVPQPDGSITPACGLVVSMQALDAILTRVVAVTEGKITVEKDEEKKDG